MSASPGTPEWWRDRLIRKYKVERPRRRNWELYYEGKQPAVVSMSKYRQAYWKLIHASRAPLGEMIVDLPAERLKVQGFRIGDATEADLELWQEVFRRNRMDALQKQVHRDAGKMGVGYVSVWHDSQGRARVAREHPGAVVHEVDAADPSKVIAAFKVWHDEPNMQLRVDVYLEDAVYQWGARVGSEIDGYIDQHITEGLGWKELARVKHNYGRVPIVPFVARLDGNGEPKSDLEGRLQLIDRIEILTTDILVSSNFASFKQRWATGIEIPTNPETGEPVETYQMAIDRIWMSEDPETKFGAIPETDIRPLIASHAAAVGELAAYTRIPATYLVHSELANPPSAQSLEAMETGLNHKVEDRQDNWSEGWEDVLALGSGAEAEDIVTSWKDHRTRSEAQMLDAAVKMVSIGMPFEAIWEFIGATPDQVSRWRRMKMVDVIGQMMQQRQQPGQAPDDEPGDDPGGQPDASAA